MSDHCIGRYHVSAPAFAPAALRPKSVRQPSAKDLAIMLFWSLWPILAVMDYYGRFGLCFMFWGTLAGLDYFGCFGLFWPFCAILVILFFHFPVFLFSCFPVSLFPCFPVSLFPCFHASML